MGLYNYFPTPGGGLLPVLVMNTILSVALFTNMVRSLVDQVVSFSSTTPNSDQDQSHDDRNPPMIRRLISVDTSSGGHGGVRRRWSLEWCCVCLSGFEAGEEVSELSHCKHFFHRGCLDKWLDDYQRRTCPLCRSSMVNLTI